LPLSMRMGVEAPGLHAGHEDHSGDHPKP
jgi:hypothetical protein